MESQAVRVLTSINGVNVVAWGESEGQVNNATDLMKKYRTMSDIMTASLDDLSELPGMGDKRVLNVYRAFQQQKREE